jgi:hypothetical protein
MRRHRWLPIVVGLAACSIVVGCGGHGSSGTPESKQDAAAIQAYQRAHMSPGVAAAADNRTERAPSAAARMVCSDEIHADVAQTFDLPTVPAGTSSWEGGLFTCTYRLPTGPLTLSVKDSLVASSGRAYFNALRAFDGTPSLLKGLSAFGLPSYETTNGRVVFLKDGKTLAVDAGSLPRVAGPAGQSRTDVAYAVAADVIGCWSE